MATSTAVYSVADVARLIRDHQTQLRAFCAQFYDDPHDRDELAQMVMIRVWRGIEGFDGRANFSTWLFRIVRNTAVTEYARRARRPLPVAVTAGTELAGLPAVPSCEESVVLHDVVSRALNCLDGRFRDTVQRVDVWGCPPAEAARLAGVAEATVRTRLFRGRRVLRAALAGEAVAPDRAADG